MKYRYGKKRSAIFVTRICICVFHCTTFVQWNKLCLDFQYHQFLSVNMCFWNIFKNFTRKYRNLVNFGFIILALNTLFHILSYAHQMKPGNLVNLKYSFPTRCSRMELAWLKGRWRPQTVKDICTVGFTNSTIKTLNLLRYAYFRVFIGATDEIIWFRL